MTVDLECALLSNTRMFAHMSQSQIKLLTMSSELRECPKGQIVFQQGEAASDVLLLVQGAVERVRRHDGRDLPLGRSEAVVWLGPGDVLLKQPRRTTAIAASDCSFLNLERPSFMQLLEQMPCLGVALSKQFAAEIVRLQDRLLEHSTERQ